VSQLLAAVLAQHDPTAKPAASHTSSTSLLPLEVILVLVGVIIGRLWGRRAGLKHLGEAEFRSRWGLVRRHRRW
jgi:hypothetical protein